MGRYETQFLLPAGTLPFQLLLLISFQLSLICVLLDEEFWAFLLLRDCRMQVLYCHYCRVAPEYLVCHPAHC